MPSSLAIALLAALPILIILTLMVGAHWSAARAGAAGLLAAMAGALLEAMFTAATILWIVFPALCIHHHQVRSRAIHVLRQSLQRLSPDPRLVAVVVAWFFALFVEGAAGFGTPVALTASRDHAVRRLRPGNSLAAGAVG